MTGSQLYRRLGYDEVATVPRWVGSFTRHILIKRLRHDENAK